MQPTVGRTVFYKSAGSADGAYPSVERAAIVTEVLGPSTVNLAVLNPTGIHFAFNVQQGSGPQQWDWIPYQKQQAEQTQEVHENDTVTYYDASGVEHSGTISKVWTQQCINISLTDGSGDVTSVPRHIEGMTGFYFVPSC